MDISAILGTESNSESYLEKLLSQKAAQAASSTATGEEQKAAEELATGSSIPKYDTLELSNDVQNTINNGEMADTVAKAEIISQTAILSEAEQLSNVSLAKYDTIELSTEALNYQNSQQTAGKAVDETKSAEEAPAGKPAGAPPAAAATESSDETSNLSTYTKQQLKDMVDNDTITQQEYNSEITRRESEEVQLESMKEQATIIEEETIPNNSEELMLDEA